MRWLHCSGCGGNSNLTPLTVHAICDWREARCSRASRLGRCSQPHGLPTYRGRTNLTAANSLTRATLRSLCFVAKQRHSVTLAFRSGTACITRCALHCNCSAALAAARRSVHAVRSDRIAPLSLQLQSPARDCARPSPAACTVVARPRHAVACRSSQPARCRTRSAQRARGTGCSRL
jgi:hypothetical protein